MSRSKPPYFPFYPLDFIGDPDVELMSTQAVGAYILLLCKAWHQEPPASLPDDDRVLARWARLTLDEWTAVRPEVIAAFTTGSDSRLHQKRLRKEYEAFKTKSRKASKAAKKRWRQSEGNADAYADAQPRQCDSTARASGSGSDSGSSPPEGESPRGGNPPPSGTPPKPTPDDRAPPAGGTPPEAWPGHWISEILRAYPQTRRGGPRAAEEAIRGALCQIEARFEQPADAADWLRRRVQAFAASPKAKSGRFCPYAKNWFAEGCYDQDDAEWQEQGEGGRQAPQEPPDVSHILGD